MSAVLPAGSNRTRLWGLTPRERLARIAAKQGLDFASGSGGGPMVANLDYAFDPAWLSYVAERPDHVVTCRGVPVVAHVPGLDARLLVTRAMLEARGLEAEAGLTLIPFEEKERPFLGRLTPETVAALERASYFGAFERGSPFREAGLALTRIAARAGITPARLAAFAALLAAAGGFLLWHAWYRTGFAAGLLFLAAGVVRRSLARCTLTSSRWSRMFGRAA
jgi:hypothetical protein